MGSSRMLGRLPRERDAEVESNIWDKGSFSWLYQYSHLRAAFIFVSTSRE